MLVFIQKVEMTGVNPSVQIPDKVMQLLFKQSKREKSPIPVKGLIEGKEFAQKIVKFQGVWQMYLNTSIRKSSYIKVGSTITIAVEFDSN